MFVHEVMELVELTSLRGALVGLPGVNGLSTEQRKRLTIAVELVANPSIIFMDEPTSGLDARAAAIVMRTVRTAVRFFFTGIIEVLFGTVFWDLGSKTNGQQDLLNAMGSMYSAVLFLGTLYATSVQPVVVVERTVFYREKAAGTYSALPYAFAQVYGFYDECQRKYGNTNAWRYCTDVFDYLTLSAIIDGTVLCVHGGLSPDVRTIDQMRVIERNCDIPHEGPFCDLMWSDPEEIETWAVSPQGAGWLFGSRVTSEVQLLSHLGLLFLICIQNGETWIFPLRYKVVLFIHLL